MIHAAQKTTRQKEGPRFFLCIFIILFAISLSAAKSKKKKSNQSENCVNVKVPQWNQPYSFLEPCVKLWDDEDCKGTYLSQQRTGMVKSVSDCSTCKSKNQTKSFLCSGPKNDRKCFKVKSICDGGFETAENETKFEISENNVQFESRDVPVTIMPLITHNFKVFDPLNRQDEDEAFVVPPVHFIAYRKSDPNLALDAETVEFRITEKVLIYIHGFATTVLDDGTSIKDAVFEGTLDVDSVILVDWRKWSLVSEDISPTYISNYKTVALVNVPNVAETVRQFIFTNLHTDNYIYLVGFSLGGQIAGLAAREAAKYGLIIDRISALDPAGPIFEYTLNGTYPLDTTHTLRISDAAYVDVIHCSKVLGMENRAGHLDTYLEENECKFPRCTHRKAIQLYISSLKRCSLITCPMSGETCSPFTVAAYGYLSDLYPGRGAHALSLWGKDCSEFMNVYSPAKHRVCFKPPYGNGDCNGKPYLTECRINCPNQKNISKVCSTHLNVRLEYENAGQNHARSLKVDASKSAQVKWYGGDCK